MTDERFAEWFEEAAQAGWSDAADFLAELRDAGYEIFRPDECDRYWMVPGTNRIEHHRGHLWVDQGPERDGVLSPPMRDGRWVRVIEDGGEG